ncbi:unnamed protein product [Gongylonema pulchrum]|uniref:Amino acid permease n=1 Tax=Gongylonema pulchrum TaxID=637853 RepID=A0A183DNL0_9BILA|nr:unnamed protein product [Gongylonema pulchrum]
MRNPTARYVSTAASLLESHGDTLDACTSYFPYINDINLAEFMSGWLFFAFYFLTGCLFLSP